VTGSEVVSGGTKESGDGLNLSQMEDGLEEGIFYEAQSSFERETGIQKSANESLGLNFFWITVLIIQF
jgi:hypothetical protein